MCNIHTHGTLIIVLPPQLAHHDLPEKRLLSAVGDFNLANNTFGDCNAEDEAYGIGGPEYNGCPQVSLLILSQS